MVKGLILKVLWSEESEESFFGKGLNIKCVVDCRERIR